MMKRFICTLGLFSLLLFASACQTTSHFGDGQLKLSYATANHFISFINDRRAKRFYVSDDGVHSTYSFCRDTSCSERARAKIVNKCNEKAFPAKCYLLANKNGIVWKNSEGFMPFNSEEVKVSYGNYFTNPKTTKTINTTKDKIGKGPIKMRDSTSRMFELFIESRNPRYEFYTGQDGSGFELGLCNVKECTEQERIKHILSCQELTNYPCYLFASKDKILWKNPGNFMAYNSDKVYAQFDSYFSDQGRDLRGQGSVRMPPQAAVNFSEFAIHPMTNKLFYLSKDGEHSHTALCPEGECSTDFVLSNQIRCDEEYTGAACYLFATHEGIVWKRPGAFMPFKSPNVESVYRNNFFLW